MKALLQFLTVLIFLTNSLNANPNSKKLLNYNHLSEISLKTLSIEILTSLNYPFVIDREINIDVVVFYRPEEKKNLELLTNVLENNGFELDFKNDIYYIKKKRRFKTPKFKATR